MTHTAFRFPGTVALITGGSSSMGLATARRLAAEGAQVIITGRDKTRLDAAAELLGPAVTAIAADAADLADLRELMRVIGERHGRLDVVFANAGIGAFGPFDAITEAEFDRVVAANLKSVYFTVQQALPLLARDASVILNASFTPYRGVTDSALYSATKAGVHALTRALAAELAPRGIRVNSVSPGFTDTPAFRAELSTEAQAAAATLVPAGRLGRPEDVAATVAFLAAPEAAYLNGQDILVDGGLIHATPTAVV